MKKLPSLLLIAALLAFAPLLRAQQPVANPSANPYDVLSRVLVPIASVFSPEAKQHALSATLVLEAMTDLPPELVETRVELLVQPPDHALLRGFYGGKLVTLCRAGDAVWIAPNILPPDALAMPPVARKKKKNQEGLGQMVLPVPPQQLALLPVLLQAKDAGETQGLRTLEVKLMTELARSLGVEGWSARLSLNAAGQPARLSLIGPGWSFTARVERLEYATSLPAATWQAPANALNLDAQQIQAWADAIGRQMAGAQQ
ncbi:MAG: hypothetical protein WCO68_11090 [Verrucomicrobiota bacterium]